MAAVVTIVGWLTAIRGLNKSLMAVVSRVLNSKVMHAADMCLACALQPPTLFLLQSMYGVS